MTFAAGDRVQVHNPGPMACGTVVEDADDGAEHVRVDFGWDGPVVSAQARLLRLVETAAQRGLD